MRIFTEKIDIYFVIKLVNIEFAIPKIVII